MEEVIVRRQPKVKIKAHHLRFKAISQNIYGLQPSQAYKDDLMRYSQALRKQKLHRYDRLIVWNNLYGRIMFNMAKKWPETVDLSTLTRAQIEADNLALPQR